MRRRKAKSLLTCPSLSPAAIRLFVALSCLLWIGAGFKKSLEKYKIKICGSPGSKMPPPAEQRLLTYQSHMANYVFLTPSGIISVWNLYAENPQNWVIFDPLHLSADVICEWSQRRTFRLNLKSFLTPSRETTHVSWTRAGLPVACNTYRLHRRRINVLRSPSVETPLSVHELGAWLWVEKVKNILESGLFVRTHCALCVYYNYKSANRSARARAFIQSCVAARRSCVPSDDEGSPLTKSMWQKRDSYLIWAGLTMRPATLHLLKFTWELSHQHLWQSCFIYQRSISK